MNRVFVIAFLLLTSASGFAQPIGKKLPEFQFKRLDGTSVSMEQLRKSSPSGVLMLTFWCTNCHSCRQAENPLFRLAQKYKGKATVLGVSSAEYDTPATVKEYLKDNKLALELVMDPGGELAHSLNVKKTTTTIILDKNARLRYQGTLMERRKFYAKETLEQVMRGKIVGQPVGPNFG